MLRRSRIRPVRRKPRPGRLKGNDLKMLRVDCYARDRGFCQNCGRMTVFDAPRQWVNSYHMHHIKAKRIGGDSLANVRTLCGKCHRESHVYGPSMKKPCPNKEAV